MGLTGKEDYATELRVKTCINLIIRPGTVIPESIQQQGERTCSKRSESGWASVANECGCQGKDFFATRVLVDKDGLQPETSEEKPDTVRVIRSDKLEALLKNDAKKMTADYAWACYNWVFCAAAALSVDVFVSGPRYAWVCRPI